MYGNAVNFRAGNMDTVAAGFMNATTSLSARICRSHMDAIQDSLSPILINSTECSAWSRPSAIVWALATVYSHVVISTELSSGVVVLHTWCWHSFS